MEKENITSRCFFTSLKFDKGGFNYINPNKDYCGNNGCGGNKVTKGIETVALSGKTVGGFNFLF